MVIFDVSVLAAVVALLGQNILVPVASFQCSMPMVGGSTRTHLSFQDPRAAGYGRTTKLMITSDYENDDLVNDRPYFGDDSFRVAEPRDGYMEDRPFFSTEGVGDTFRVGGRPVDGHRVIRPSRDGPRPPTERGDHMRVTTANPHFLRTDRPHRERPFDEFDGQYGPRDGISRGGREPFRPNSQDLRGIGRMPMQNDEWYRYRESREPESRFRPVNSRRMGGYDRDMDDIRPPGGTRGRDDLPHFMTDDGKGLPVDGGDRVSSSSREPRDFELINRDGPLGSDRMSLREKEWMDLEDRRRHRRPRASPQDLRGVGRMPMRGREWDDYKYPERRGARRPYDDDYRRGDEYDHDLDYPRDDYRAGFSRRQPYRRRGARDDYPDDLPPPPPPPLDDDIRDSRRVGYDDGDYVRDGPHMIRNGLPSYSEDSPPPLEEERRLGSGRFGEDELYDEGRDFDDRAPGGRDFYADMGQPRDRMLMRRERSRDLFNSRQRDRPGSVGGPLDEESMGVDTRYTSTRQSWRTGTSYDTI